MPAPDQTESFIRTWRDSTLNERSGAQQHFIGLCRLLDLEPPAEADPRGEWFTFEKGAKKTGGGDGWADVWRRHCFAWEYKGKHKDLNAALRQLRQYALALENPPLLIASDMETIEIHTHFSNTVNVVHRLALADLADPDQLQKLRWAFVEPERLKPGQTREAVTEVAARLLGDLAQRLRQRGHPPQPVAHFITRLLFCLFAEDIGLLPDRLFGDLLAEARRNPAEFPALAGGLFRAMQSGGRFGLTRIAWFNGGLFDDDACLPLERADLDLLHSAAALDWSAIEPAIFGTLFERGLDPDKRGQLGAHYTDAGSIRRLVDPSIREPLLAEWAAVKADIAGRTSKTGPKVRQQGADRLHGFLERLRTFRVLDPACGSGNFLYLALRTLKDIEHQAMLEAETLGLQRGFPAVGPEAVLGIELNPYAAELARLTVWIGEIQWMLGHGYSLNDQPILKPLDTIECRDALLDGDREASWPAADAIVGNPPFLGDKKQLSELGAAYVEALRQTYQGRVPGGADLVCYWFEKARAHIEAGLAQRAGLVATNSIRQKRNRPVLERIRASGVIFHAWSDLEWINEGAAVRVSLVAFGNPPQPPFFKGGSHASLDPPLKKGGGEAGGIFLNGQPVAAIHADLTGSNETTGALDLTQARPLPENAGCSFFGLCLAGAFAVDGDTARRWLGQPNPHGRSNSEVLRPIWNGVDVTQGWKGRWVIDFGADLSEGEAALYEMPFAHVLAKVKPVRMNNREKSRVEYWWRHGRPRPELRRKLAGLTRYIATPETAKHRFFVWFPISAAPEHSLIVIPREDDATFGVLSSRFHIVWALAKGGTLEDRPRYNSTMTFETFPFPAGLTPNIPASAYAADPRAQAIAAAARTLNELRENWLNPSPWVERIPEISPLPAGEGPGVRAYPDRLIPRPEHAAELKKRTLTNLYNQRPAWLANAHRALDEAVAAAYGWPADLGDDQILRRLLELNLARATR
ncbi:MAG: class I SAM-dependent DNA methyltransferase [Candidatus Competibacter sp.]|nr:class I SAM-dependent DNA methyltransferase [Candidatus Competibacter sp.]MDG4582744.1 class I SAM-dependent DNA methyltransferase [Candidatus Competibacter sp.]